MSLLTGSPDADAQAGVDKAADTTGAGENQDDRSSGNGNGNSQWNEGVDESMRERMGKFKDVNGLAKSYIELEDKLAGGFKMPETDEDKAKLFEKLGRPTDAEGYELEGEDEIGFKTQAFQAGLSQGQLTSLSQWFKGVVERHNEGLSEIGEASEVKLREKWGDKYKDNLALADRELSTIYSENLIDRLNKGGFLDDHEFVANLYRLGKRSADDSIGSGGNLTEVDRTEAGQPFLDFPSMQEYE